MRWETLKVGSKLRAILQPRPQNHPRHLQDAAERDGAEVRPSPQKSRQTGAAIAFHAIVSDNNSRVGRAYFERLCSYAHGGFRTVGK